VTNEVPVTAEQIVEQLSLRRADAVGTLELLRGYQAQVEQERAQLENPQAVREYIAFFEDFIARAIQAIDRDSDSLPHGALRDQAVELRAITNQASLEQRRCLLFRDKWINKPLPFERLRPMLNEISVTTRDQLTAFRDLAIAASRIEQLLPVEPPPPAADKTFDRRALFTRFIRPLEK
jgi:hypothetical protein